MIKLLTGNEAMALGARLCRVNVVAAYPITPQSQVTETLAGWVEQGELKAEYITVESEHSALGVCIGAASVGARTFTATSANGLAYMCEQLHWAGGARLPLVLGCVNRAMGAPWSILNDQQDSMSQRDAGWIQLYARNNQEILDSVIQAYRLAESLSVPVMVCYDGFILSHTVMPVDVPEQDEVDQFLPAYKPQTVLEPSDPRNVNQVVLPTPRADAGGVMRQGYMEFRKALQDSLLDAGRALTSIDQDFECRFGRSHGGMLNRYGSKTADVALIAAGSLALEASVAVDQLCEDELNAGVLGIRLYRPFPGKELIAALQPVRHVFVFDKSVSYGNEGPICADLKAALYGVVNRPVVHGCIAGLGGRDVKARELVTWIKETLTNSNGKSLNPEPHWLNCGMADAIRVPDVLNNESVCITEGGCCENDPTDCS